MLIIDATTADLIHQLDRARTDGGLGVIFDGTQYRCRDVRADPAYADYWPVLAAATVHQPPVTRLQARLALIQAELWAFIEAYFSDPARTPAEIAYFADAQTWRRDDPTLQSAATALSLTEAQLDDLFALAATL